jgi:sulfhydrogenase subunit gamma (sulfur reductase)
MPENNSESKCPPSSCAANTCTAYLPTRAILSKVTEMAYDNYLFEFEQIDPIFSSCLPGQFVELWIPGVGESPISVCSGRVGGTLPLLIRKAGRVTKALFNLKLGDWVGLRGPYGHGFPVELYKGQNVCMIAGGLGVAPLRSVWQYLINHRQDYGRLVLIYGMKHSDEILFADELMALRQSHELELFLAAEDVTVCHIANLDIDAGRVTDLIDVAELSSDMQVAICGPPVMYRFAVESLRRKGIADERIWLSLERHMKCGIGKCGHCFIGGKFACQEGPVFQVTELANMHEVIEYPREKIQI